MLFRVFFYLLMYYILVYLSYFFHCIILSRIIYQSIGLDVTFKNHSTAHFHEKYFYV